MSRGSGIMLSDFVGYLPYGVRVYEVGSGEVGVLELSDVGRVLSGELLLVLHPEEDMIRRISVPSYCGGSPSVPLVEIAYGCCGRVAESEGVRFVFRSKDCAGYTTTEGGTVYLVPTGDGVSQFVYMSAISGFCVLDVSSEDSYPCPDALLGYDRLCAFHLDFRDLIGRGLALSVHDARVLSATGGGSDV